MSVEAATYIADLQPVNPPSTDPRSQGDDQIRLIKQVLQNTFPGAARAFQLPSTKSVSTSSSLVSGDGQSTIYCSTAAGAVTITLPALTSADKGWSVGFIKTSLDVNPMYIIPASGSINSGGYSVAKARRCIPGRRVVAVWDGANWFIERASTLPMGCLVDFWGTVLPAGYEWPNGQTLASLSTNYPELALAFGTGALPDVRGYVCATLDNLGGASANRLPNTTVTGIAPGTLGSAAGVDARTLVSANLPPYTPAGTIANGSISISHNAAAQSGGSSTPGGAFGLNSPAGASISASQNTSTFTGTAAPGQTSTPFSNLQPTIMCGKIMVVE